MLRNRFFYFSLIIVSGGIISFFLIKSKAKTEIPITLSPVFQLLGKPVKTLDRSFTKLMPISNLDERQLGDSIALRYESYADTKDPDLIYLRKLIDKLSINNGKKFNYRIFLMDTVTPNAYAMPGGVLFVTKGLLEVLESEAELVAVFGHEIGHVELSHCMDQVRGELLTQKIDAASLGVLADLTASLLLRPTFSKNQEDEADEFGFQILIREGYDPSAMGRVFLKLMQDGNGREQVNTPLQEFFMTHPYLSNRNEKYRERAKQQNQYGTYIGKTNLKNRITRYEKEYKDDFNL